MTMPTPLGRARRVNPVHHFAFAVGLPAIGGEAEARGRIAAQLFYIRQRRGPIGLRLPRPQQIKVGDVQHKDCSAPLRGSFGHPSPGSSMKTATLVAMVCFIGNGIGEGKAEPHAMARLSPISDGEQELVELAGALATGLAAMGLMTFSLNARGRPRRPSPARRSRSSASR